MAGQAPMSFRSVQLEIIPPRATAAQNMSAVTVDVEPRRLLLAEPGGRARTIAFDQVHSIQPGNYRLNVQMLDGSRLVFSRLGYDYEAFLFQVYSAWNAFVSDALFIDEPRLLEVKGRYACSDPGQALLGLPAVQEADPDGNTRFRVFDSSLLVLPLRAPVRRVPLCFVDDIRREGLAISLQTAYDESLQVNWLGYDTDALHLALTQAIQRQCDKALAILEEAAVDSPIDHQILRSAAWLLRPGRGADWQALQAESPELTQWLDRLLRKWSPDGYYDALRRLVDAAGGRLMIGVRREQPSDTLTGEKEELAARAEAAETAASAASAAPEDAAGTAGQTAMEAADQTAASTADAAGDGPIPAFWLAAWLPGAHPSLVVELIASKPLAQATYVFDGPVRVDDWALHAQLLNRGLEAVDFRRQPVYLPMDTLRQPAYQRDLAALRFCAPLSFLRTQFRGRAIHRSLNGWQSSLKALLAKG